MKMIDISYIASCEDFKVEFSFGTVQEAAGITEESIGERFAVYHILFFAQCDVELAKVLRPQLRELVVTYVQKEAVDIAFLTRYRGACELVWRDVLEPVL